MQVPIKRTVERIPGGFMLVPLVAGAVANTCMPHAAQFFGSFTGALFTGALPILAVFYDCMGSTIAVRSLPQLAKRGGALLALEAMGQIQDISQVAPHLDGPIEPNKEPGEIYRQAAKRQEELYHLLLGER